MQPGEIISAKPDIELPASDDIVYLEVTNTSDRVIQVTSHYHFFEANPMLYFDRALSAGRRLDVPAGTGTRFQPGETITVPLRPFGGHRRILGFAGLFNGWHGDDSCVRQAIARARLKGYAMPGVVSEDGC